MKTPKLNFRMASFMALTALALTAISCSDNDDDSTGGTSAPNVNFTALSNNNSIVKYNATNLATPISTTPITGLSGGE